MNRRTFSLTVLLAAAPAGIGSVAARQTGTPEVSPSSEYARPDWLVDADWTAANLHDPGITIVGLVPADDFSAGHIPGAAQVDWPDLEVVETGDQSIASWRGEIEGILTKLGIERADTVVVHDNGSFYAARLWWILHQLGHADVRILNGGLETWTAAGYDVESGEATPEPASERYVGEPDETALAQIEEVEAALEEGATILVDARTPDEYRAGHIPGAVNIPFTENAVSDGPPTWKSASDLRAMYTAAGVTPDMRVIPYCTTGVRSAATYFTLRLLGYEDVSLFTGSYVEWTSDPERPVTTGDTP